MSRTKDLMNRREREIKEALLHIKEKSSDFKNPKLVLIGGYAIRNFVKLPRYTRDCDFILRGNIDEMKKIIPPKYTIQKESSEKDFGFAKCVKFIKHEEKKIKVSIDFMISQIRGREKEEVILIDEKMIDNSVSRSIEISSKKMHSFLPKIEDYLIMKIVSGRASDIRDIASILAENDIPKNITKRVKEILPYPEIFEKKIKSVILPEISKSFFLDSWRGVFATTKYTEDSKREVISKLKKLVE